ncbi:hydroxyquinol 1,2-dioxygenase [Neopusillimonas aromaticivorans]|uniref:hydroxyquinol 1,2-dioxygenase n=1 Tax=Neopusillimonas aromaticivorans TaxID=2979868 RepID=UPI002596708C|nr:hydroxyquinol 1,2-dioxygenase [Neopusillimonas aromaticivorans]WJJ92691.1 hydroxyquinol 1,2-dioxygenase [Neopusillimonas aromaticivorans]
MQYTTKFGSLEHYEKGGVQVINDNAKNYAFSNCFEIANTSKPYEKVVFGINQIYVLETLRAEGDSPWYTCAHDEFALCMDKDVDVHLIKLDPSQHVQDPEKNGAVLVQGDPKGQKMGWIRLRRGHQAMLPANTAYQFRAAKPSVIVLQTCIGDLSVEKWADICQAA